MSYHYIWLSSNPNIAEHLRRASEDRSAYVYRKLGTLRRLLSGTKDAVLDLVDWFRRRVQERAVLRELSALDDLSLKDIGISRSDIYRVAIDSVAAAADRRRRPAETPDDPAAGTSKEPAWLRGVVAGDRPTPKRSARRDKAA